MAAPSKNVRIRLFFENIAEINEYLEQGYWFLVDSKSTPYISSFEHEISKRFGLVNLVTGIKLYLDGYRLPTWESTQILRDGDLVRVKVLKPVSCGPGNVALPSKISKKVDQNSQPKKKQKQREDEEISGDDSDMEASEPDEVFSKKPAKVAKTDQSRLHKPPENHRLVYQGSVASVDDSDSSSSDSEDETAAKKLKSTVASENFKAPKKQIPEILVHEPPGKKQKVDGKDSEDDEESDQTEGTTPAKTPPEKRKRRRRTRKRNKKQPDTPFAIPQSKPSNENTQENSNKMAVKCLTSFRPPNVRSDAIHIRFGSDDDSTTSRNMNESQHSSGFDADISSAVIDQEKQPSTDLESRYVADENTNTNRQLQQDKSDNADTPTIQEYVLQPKGKKGRNKNSPQDLVVGARVFQRQKFKRKAFVPLSKDEQLQSVQTNKSVVLMNEQGDGGESQMDVADLDPKPEEEAGESVPERDYTSCPLMNGTPRPGDKLAFKMLEMSACYTPEISDYKVGTVLGYDPSSQNVEIELEKAHSKKGNKEGRFEMTVEDEDSILTTSDMAAQSQISVLWTCMVEPRLVPA